jgi:fumarate hydratase, class II
MNNHFRLEYDSIGEVRIPEHALWGGQTQRAIDNFNISAIRFPRQFIRSLGLIKFAAAQANFKLGLISGEIATPILQACTEMVSGTLDEYFPLDIFQTGSGTSTNMNANEVIANRAIQILGGKIGSKTPVHPNDHVNASQSSNDVFPTAIHVSTVLAIRDRLQPVLHLLKQVLKKKSEEFADVIKTGRTHLQDATPITLGQEFGGYMTQIEKGIARTNKAVEMLRELPLGGTAVGSGINRHPAFPELAIGTLNAMTGESFFEASDHFEANSARDACLETSGQIRTIAASLIKIANDIRWMSSGPRNGLAEIILPAVQPGSSIMPGKVNPVIAEALLMVAVQVMANDQAISLAVISGNFELNVMMPLIAYNLLHSIELLSNAIETFTQKCVSGIRADEKRCRESVDKGLMLATALTPYIGYDKAAEVSKKAHETGKTIREMALDMALFPERELEEILDPSRMIYPSANADEATKSQEKDK